MNEFERDFVADSREKKSIAQSARHRAPRRKGYRGAIRTPSDVMSKEDKMDYTAAGPVLDLAKPRTWAEIKELTKDERKEVLVYWASHYAIKGTSDLSKAEGIPYATANTFLQRLGIKEDMRKAYEDTPLRDRAEARDRRYQRRYEFLGIQGAKPSREPADVNGAEKVICKSNLPQMLSIRRQGDVRGDELRSFVEALVAIAGLVKYQLTIDVQGVSCEQSQ